MTGKPIEYQDGDLTLEGYAVWPEASGLRPVVLLCHAWSGRDDFVCEKAEQLSKEGYITMALDVYGKGKLGQTREEKQALMGPLMKDRAKLHRRLSLGADTARGLRRADTTRMAAVGYCFGGLCVLDMARAGEDLRGVVSVHGLLQPAEGLPTETIVAKVLALHGWDDPMVPPDRVTALAKELSEAGVDWQLHAYGQTMHAFTNPAATDPEQGTLYDPLADQRATIAIQAFLAECLQ